ncbi:MAG: thiolase family protein [Pseudomonadota bacterium]|nr:thiolase family protein [Pseudomonadota bacterium]
MSGSDDIFIVGVGMTKFGLFPERSIKAMVAESVKACLDDASASVEDVKALFFSNVGQGILEGQSGTPGQMALRPLGFESVPTVNVENACASGSSALYLAWTHLKAGMADFAMAVGAEKLSIEDTDVRDGLFEGGLDVHDRAAVIDTLKELAGDEALPDVDGHRSLFMDIYGFWTRAHMKEFGTTQEQLAAISSKNHYHSSFNPFCQFQRQFTIEEVLAARPLAYPLTVPMCSPYSDGSAAVLLATGEGVRKLGAQATSVKVSALQLATGTDRDIRDWDHHITKLAADAAYEMAGLSPQDMDVAEVHDATAFGELLNSENIGLVPRGDGGPAAARGDTTLGGRIPINVSGGLESRGHPLGATGLAQVAELTTQLRGRAGKRQVENAKRAVLENGGGLHGVEEAAAVIGIFEAAGA